MKIIFSERAWIDGILRRDKSAEWPRSARCESQTPTKPTSILEGETGSRLEFRSGGEAYPLRRSQGDGDDDAEVVVAHTTGADPRESSRSNFLFPSTIN